MKNRVEADFDWVEEHDGQLYTPLQPKRKSQSKKRDFVGWGSRELIEFLKSIGKETHNQISQYDVASIITGYINENNLNHPTKKKRVVCDERLQFLFGKKNISRIKIYDLLSVHYLENKESSDEDFWSSGDDVIPAKRDRSVSLRTVQKKRVVETPKSCFAAIIPHNIKLLYLKRSLVQEILKDFDSFEHKVVGSFVRIKSDPNDYLQKNPFQLVQVTGIKVSGNTDNVLLQVPAREIRISSLSDDSFSEEECDELCQKVKDGLHRRLTVVELEEKARLLHEDITKHWLVREIALLKDLIERANEKGWRKELAEYLDRRRLLQSEAEKARLLHEVPKVIAEAIKVDSVVNNYSEVNSFPDDEIDDALSSPERMPTESSGINRLNTVNIASKGDKLACNAQMIDSADPKAALASPASNFGRNPEIIIPNFSNAAALNCETKSTEHCCNSQARQDQNHLVEKDQSREKPVTVRIDTKKGPQGRLDNTVKMPQVIEFSSIMPEVNRFVASSDKTVLSFNAVGMASVAHRKGSHIEESQKQQAGRNKISNDVPVILELDKGAQGTTERTVEAPQVINFSFTKSEVTRVSDASNLAATAGTAQIMTMATAAKAHQVISFTHIEPEITGVSAASNLATSAGIALTTCSTEHWPGVQVQEHRTQPPVISGVGRNLSMNLIKNNTAMVEKKPEAAPAQVIDLSSDDEEGTQVPTSQSQNPIVSQAPILSQTPVLSQAPVLTIETPIWYYMDPQGTTQGPFSLGKLKEWSDASYFPPDFRVWTVGQNPRQAVLLTYVFSWFFRS